jgi:hypothetical protein
MRRAAARHGIAIGLVILALYTWAQVGSIRSDAAPGYPVRAAAEIPRGCRLLNEDVDGGFLLDRRPDLRVSQDGRQFEKVSMLIRQQRVLEARGAWQAWLDDYGVDCVLARPDRGIVRELEQVGWPKVAVDPTAVLLVRPGLVE